MNTPTSSLETKHFPVMLKEVIKICNPKKGGNFIDCTFGGGGYSKEILRYPKTKVIALDRDKSVISRAKKISDKFSERFSFFNERFSNVDAVINKNFSADAIIFDLGISSFQLMDLSRGFSFKSKEKIDMQMGLSSISAEEIINSYDSDKLNLIIRLLGEEKESSRIVKNILKARKIKKISTVSDLVEIIEKSKKRNFKKKINVCTKTFQALRIFVNKEITELIDGIVKATKLVKYGGKIIVISFHSIEDKIVKFYFSNYSRNQSRPSRYLPEEDKKNIIFFQEYKKNLLKPSLLEVKRNPSSRSAKLRFVTRDKNNFTNPIILKKKFSKYLDLESINV
tara:strand:+ start:883 stop:1899 length:1017 start_codon:yes stop_codon:yes gene_type:complete